VPRLTKQIVDAARPRSEKYIVWDSALPGFGLRVMPKGTRAYIAVYRLNGKQRWVTLARADRLTPDQARKAAQVVMGKVAVGDDPAAEKARKRKAGTIASLLDRAMAEHWLPHAKPRTVQEAGRIIKRHLIPELDQIPIADLDSEHVAKLHHKLRGTPRLANLTIAILSKALSLAERWKLRPQGTNPCHLIQRFKESHRTRTLAPDELRRLGAVLDRAHKGLGVPIVAIHAIRLLALSGARLGEILGLRWGDVDFGRHVFVLADSKVGARDHSFGKETAALLRSIPKSDSEWVLPRVDEPDKPLRPDTLNTYWRKIREDAELDGLRLHDLRHHMASTAGATGANAFMIRDKLGHATIAMSSKYVHDTGLRDLSDRVEAVIAGGMSSKGRVVQLKQKGVR
jgi:integrase